MRDNIKLLKEKIKYWKNDPRIMIQEENYKVLQVIENILKERQADKERIKDSVPKAKVEEALDAIEYYFYRINVPDEDIEYIQNVKQELLKEKENKEDEKFN